jgi:hypothetical protein
MTYAEIVDDPKLAQDPFEKTARLLDLVIEPELAEEARALKFDLDRLDRDTTGDYWPDPDRLTHIENRLYALAEEIQEPLADVCIPDPGPIAFWLENIPLAFDDLGTTFRAVAIETSLDDLRSWSLDDLDEPAEPGQTPDDNGPSLTITA